MLELVQSAIEREGLCWEAIWEAADEVFVFGSTACGLSNATSDVDVLCVGRGKRRQSSRLELIWIPAERVLTDRWLGSDLANHVARFGICLKGTPAWTSRVFVSPASRALKESQIRAAVKALRHYFCQLSIPYRSKRLLLLRRNIQRLLILRQGGAIPPVPMLDDQWSRCGWSWKDLMTEADLERFLSPGLCCWLSRTTESSRNSG